MTLEEQLEQPVCLASKVAVLTATTALHTNTTLTCHACNFPVPNSVVSSQGRSCPMIISPDTRAGELLLVQVSRPPGLTTILREPAREAVWGGRRLAAVITHAGLGSLEHGGHCRTYVRIGETWWKLESIPVRAVKENPFLCQDQHKITMLAFF